MQLKSIDNLDDRKQIVIQLDHMETEDRLAFLKWAIDLAPINIAATTGKKPLRVVKGDGRENPFPWGSSEQVYFDLMIGIHQHGVPVDVVLNELEKRAANKRLTR